MDFQELLKNAVDSNGQGDGTTANDSNDFACLDHAYFIEELKNLLNMHKQTEQNYWKRGQRPTTLDQQALDQISERALDLQFACHEFQHFDPNVMLTEVNELSEMLCRVKSGKFKSETGDEAELFEEADYGKYPDWDDDYFQIEDAGNKPLQKLYVNNFSIEVKNSKQSFKKGKNKKKWKKASTLNE